MDCNYAAYPGDRHIMKRSSTICLTLAGAITLASIALSASAQQSAQKPAPKPPVLEKLDEGQAPDITIRPSERETAIKEKREQGKVTEVQVKSGGSNYVIKSNDQPGSIQPGEAQSTSMRVPQWQILDFDLGMRKEKPEGDKTAPPPTAK